MNPFFLFLLQFCFPTVGRRLCTSSICGIVHNKSRIGIISTVSLVQNPQGTPCMDTETTSMLIGVIGLAYWLHSEPVARQRFFQRKSSICISQAASFFFCCPEHKESRCPQDVATVTRFYAQACEMGLQGEHVRSKGGAIATSCLLGVPLGHNSSFLQGPAFSPPRIREAIWCGSTNSTTETGVIKCLLPYRFLVLVLRACHLCLKTGRLIFSPKVCSLISQKQYSRWLGGGGGLQARTSRMCEYWQM